MWESKKTKNLKKGGERMRKLMRRNRGFTLIEMLVVMAIIAILAAVVAASVAGTGPDTRAASKATDLDGVQQAVDRYEADNSVFPYENAQPAVDLDDTAVLATMFDTIDWDLLVTDYLHEAPSYSTANPAEIAVSKQIDMDMDGTADFIVDGVTAYDPTGAWQIDKTGLVYCLVGSEYYGQTFADSLIVLLN